MWCEIDMSFHNKNPLPQAVFYPPLLKEVQRFRRLGESCTRERTWLVAGLTQPLKDRGIHLFIWNQKLESQKSQVLGISDVKYHDTTK